MTQSVVLVTGAATGIGALTVRSLAKAGHVVYASMRDIAGRNAAKVRELRDWGFANGADVRVVELDVLSQASADAAVATIVADRGRLDAVVHNAGHLVIGPTEAFTPEEIAQVFDTNFLGTQRVNRAALPVLRKQGRGLVLWVSSSTVRGGFPPFLGPYAAAKAAMDSLAVSMSYELARFGIETSIVVPGAFTAGTEHFPKAGKPADAGTAAAYARYDGLLDQVGARLSELSPPESDPAAVGEEIARIVSLPHGERPFRSVVDFINDGAAEVTEVAERVRQEFAQRIGIADLLKVNA
jgi:NAD(P)-dependent dehydrogenase (short-subunit alcohol dehydrogenase family)